MKPVGDEPGHDGDGHSHPARSLNLRHAMAVDEFDRQLLPRVQQSQRSVNLPSPRRAGRRLSR